MITVNIEKARNIAHPLRREKRDALYIPIDRGSPHAVLNAEGESLRAAVKAEDDAIQIEIEGAKTVEDLTAVMAKL